MPRKRPADCIPAGTSAGAAQRPSRRAPTPAGTERSPAALLTYTAAAHDLAISTKTLRRAVKAGDLPVVRVGRSVRFEPADLEAFRQRHRQGGTAASVSEPDVWKARLPSEWAPVLTLVNKRARQSTSDAPATNAGTG
jgi:excisionase family DNA binding protein